MRKMKKMKKMKGGMGYIAGSMAGSAIDGVANVIVNQLISATKGMGGAITSDMEKIITVRKNAVKEIIVDLRDATKDIIAQTKNTIQSALPAPKPTPASASGPASGPATTPDTTQRGGKHKSHKSHKSHKNINKFKFRRSKKQIRSKRSLNKKY